MKFVSSLQSSVFFLKKLQFRLLKSSKFKFNFFLFKEILGFKSNTPVVVKITVRFSRSNVFVTVQDFVTKKILFAKSSGSLGQKGRQRQTTIACFRLLHSLFQVLIQNSIQFFSLEFIGQNFLRRFFLRHLLHFVKIRLKFHRRFKLLFRGGKKPFFQQLIFPKAVCFLVRNNSKIAFNGCRKRKQRRR